MLHEWIQIWFSWVELGGYVGVFALMALESSIVPVPSELVMAPAAFWAMQGRMNLWWVIIAGTLGSYVGSIISYWLSDWLGHPLIEKYGKYFLISKTKLQRAEVWISQFGSLGVFIARFLPVVRHLISIPAGLLRMPFRKFSFATLLGAGSWCAILAFFGAHVLGQNPKLLDSPREMIWVIQSQMTWFLGAVILFAVLYCIAVFFKRD